MIHLRLQPFFFEERNVGDSLWKCRFDRLTSSLLHSFSPIRFKSRKLASFLHHFSKQYLLYCKFSCDRNVSALSSRRFEFLIRLPPRHPIENHQYSLLIVPFLPSTFQYIYIYNDTLGKIYNSMTKI